MPYELCFCTWSLQMLQMGLISDIACPPELHGIYIRLTRLAVAARVRSSPCGVSSPC